ALQVSAMMSRGVALICFTIPLTDEPYKPPAQPALSTARMEQANQRREPMKISVINYAAELRDHALVLDTETTGGSASAEVIELGIVMASDGRILINQLYQPTQEIDRFAEKTHGIKASHLVGAPRISEQWEAIHGVLHGKTVIAWNAAVDRRYL